MKLSFTKELYVLIALAVLNFVSFDTLAEVITSVIDEDLDIVSQLEYYEAVVESETGPSLVSYGPKLVVGQGDDSSNYTVVKILNKFQIAELQFLAYPSSIRGGVNVAAGRLFSDEMSIVTCPISDTSTREIRVFNQYGELVSSFSPTNVLTAPFVITSGDFITGNETQEIAIASQYQEETNRDILIYNAEGSLLNTVQTPLEYEESSDTLIISSIREKSLDKLLLYFQDSKTAFVVNPSTEISTEYNLQTLPDESSVFASAFEDQRFVAGTPETLLSTLHIIDEKGDISSVDAAVRENRFWVASYYDQWNDLKYVKNSRFMHIRTEHLSDNYMGTDFTADAYDDWVGSYADASISALLDGYNTKLPAMWEPTFTHRQHATQYTLNWLEVSDEDTGLPKYAMLSRLDNIVVDGEGFYCFTYAPGLPALDCLYRWPQRAFLRQLGLCFRGDDGHPEHLVGLEPSHEFEIVSGGDSSIGDYNPKMISSFYDYLVKRYRSIGRVNELYGSSFTSSNFDAPRNLSRGDWDIYDTENGFFNEWVEYNRKMVFGRIAQGFAEALIAGFPPEVIKTHQIPQGYAISQPITGYRISPIDWIFSAGTGYGGTRYGVWYSNAVNWIQGAYSSGQTMISVGEYDPITSSQTSASEQLSYMFNNGVNFIHCMGMSDDTINRNATLSLESEGARPGTSGGIGQIRPVVVPDTFGEKAYNIVCVGTGEGKPGLLKSVNSYGNWEGTVYVVPFHSAIEITPIGTEDRNFHLISSQYSSGNITGLKAGDQIEIRFNAKTQSSEGVLTLLVLHEGMEIKRHYINISNDWDFNRYVLRIQGLMGKVTVLMNSGKRDTSTAYNQDIEMESFSVLVHKEQVARKRYDITAGTPHSGGVTFDILSADYIKYDCSVTGDINNDCSVDFDDFTILASNWLTN
ncbi:MAG: hypothetical protein ACIAQZ_09800 [Sedimentisphaeraceae bacterium JB056]